MVVKSPRLHSDVSLGELYKIDGAGFNSVLM